MLDGTVLDTPLVGEGMDQQAGWAELLREVADSAVGELLATTGKKMPHRKNLSQLRERARFRGPFS